MNTVRIANVALDITTQTIFTGTGGLNVIPYVTSFKMIPPQVSWWPHPRDGAKNL